MNLNRCGWCGTDELYCRYHDEEWGVPVRDDGKMFEFLMLETFQAGLSWITVLRKRENFRRAFHRFDPRKMAGMDETDVQRLMQDTGIIRNGAKIRAAIHNARCFLELQENGVSFSDFLWQFTGGKTRVNQWNSLKEIPASNPESDAMSKALKQAGFKFVGTTVCYAHMQATGMVNDHLSDCFRYSQLVK